MKVVTVKFGGVDKRNIRFSLGGVVFLRRAEGLPGGFFFSLGERLTVVEDNYPQGGKEPVRRRQVLGGST